VKRPSRRTPEGARGAELPRLYDDLAWLWPILSPPDHYREEAGTLLDVFAALSPAKPAQANAARGKRAARPRLLELGAGGGHLLLHLSRRFECTATDLSAAMLENCKRLVPKVRRVLGDMRSLRLEEQFEAVLIHDAIDYMRTAADVRAALATAAAHLGPGGVLFVAPTYTKNNFVDGEAEHDADESANLTYLSYVHDPDPLDSEYELMLVYLIRDPRTRAVEPTVDRHRCGLFSQREWLAFLREAGFAARAVEDDKAWTLFAGTKRAAPRRRRPLAG
jgi:SAM-dependent methyltransferase